MRYLPIGAMALTVLSSKVNAWFGKGHLLVARIAQDVLKEDSPETITKVEGILQILKKSDPEWTKKEGKHPIVECATFADDIKGKGARW